MTPKEVIDLLFEMGLCSCMDFEEYTDAIKEFLEWALNGHKPQYDSLYGGDRGAYYIICGTLDKHGLIAHGTSLRFPFITPKGAELLNALNTYSLLEGKLQNELTNMVNSIMFRKEE